MSHPYLTLHTKSFVCALGIHWFGKAFVKYMYNISSLRYSYVVAPSGSNVCRESVFQMSANEFSVTSHVRYVQVLVQYVTNLEYHSPPFWLTIGSHPFSLPAKLERTKPFLTLGFGLGFACTSRPTVHEPCTAAGIRSESQGSIQSILFPFGRRACCCVSWPMQRRSSGSTTDEDDDDDDNDKCLAVGASDINGDGQQRKTSSESGHEVARTSSTLDRRKRDSAYAAPTRQPGWNPPPPTANGSLQRKQKATTPLTPAGNTIVEMPEPAMARRSRTRSPWSCSLLTLTTTGLSFVVLFSIVHSFLTRQLDPKGCRMSMMRPAFAKFSDFDTEHTRFASKYSLYLYREGGIDEDTMVSLFPLDKHEISLNVCLGQRCPRALHTRQCRKL